MGGWGPKDDGGDEMNSFVGGGKGVIGLYQHDILGAPCLVTSKCQNSDCV